MSAAHYKIDTLTAIVDFNGMQLDGFTRDIMSLEPMAEKWSAFGWQVLEIDGHKIRQILDALDSAEKVKSKPTVIIAHTIKGKGVPFMENQVYYHGKPVSEESLERALTELSGGNMG